MQVFAAASWSQRLAAAACTAIAAAQAQWRIEDGPAPTTQHVAYDEARAELVVLADRETWVHDGNRWQPHAMPIALQNRTEALLDFDEARRRVVLFGGRVGTTTYGDTWEWDGAAWALVNDDPLLRTAEGLMTFDTTRGRLVRHGMDASAVWRMWEWDGRSWTQFGTSIGLGGLVCDRANQRLLGIADFLYEWRGGAWTVAVYSRLPAGFTDWRFAYDRARDDVVAFGGGVTSIVAHLWNGASYVPVSTGPSPWGRQIFQPVWDASRQRLLVHGGRDTNRFGLRVDTWEWDGAAWFERDTPMALRAVPGPVFANVAWDPARRRVVVFQSSHYGPTESGIREWDGRHWHRGPELTPIPVGTLGAMVHDAARQRMVIVTGGMGPRLQTWSYDGAAITEIQTANAPPDRLGFDVAYDAARDRVVLFGGGSPPPVTWLFDGIDWQPSPAATPPSMSGHRMVYDPVRQQTVLFSTAAQTWIWDGAAWSSRSTPTGLTTRVGFAMTWDDARQRVVLTGGGNPNAQPNGYVLRPAQLWEWDGAGWTERTTLGLPQSLSASLVSTGDSLLLLGGNQPHPGCVVRRLVEPPFATVTTYGAGCAGSFGVPILDADWLPSVGHTAFGVRLTSAPAQALAAVLFASTAAAVPLGNGCTQLIGGPLAVHVGSTDAGGVFRVPLAIPADPVFLGVRLRAQGAVFDPNGAWNGLSSTRGIELMVGR